MRNFVRCHCRCHCHCHCHCRFVLALIWAFRAFVYWSWPQGPQTTTKDHKGPQTTTACTGHGASPRYILPSKSPKNMDRQHLGVDAFDDALSPEYRPFGAASSKPTLCTRVPQCKLSLHMSCEQNERLTKKSSGKKLNFDRDTSTNLANNRRLWCLKRAGVDTIEADVGEPEGRISLCDVHD